MPIPDAGDLELKRFVQSDAIAASELDAITIATTAPTASSTMPVMSGEEAFAIMREVAPHVKILLSSGHDEQETMRRFAGRGVDCFIHKRYTTAALAAKIESALSGAKSQGGSA